MHILSLNLSTLYKSTISEGDLGAVDIHALRLQSRSDHVALGHVIGMTGHGVGPGQSHGKRTEDLMLGITELASKL